jgi:hypothetical protein
MPAMGRDAPASLPESPTYRVAQVHIGNRGALVKPPSGFELIPLCFERIASAGKAHFDEKIPEEVIDDLRLLHDFPRLCFWCARLWRRLLQITKEA